MGWFSRTPAPQKAVDPVAEAETFRRQGRPIDALKCYERAIFRHPTPELWRKKGMLLLFALARPEKAVECFDIAMNTGLHADADLALHKGICLMQMGRPDQAIPCFERALRAGPRPVAEALRGEALRRAGRGREAEEALRRAREADAGAPAEAERLAKKSA